MLTSAAMSSMLDYRYLTSPPDAVVLLQRAGHTPGDLESLDVWDSRLERLSGG